MHTPGSTAALAVGLASILTMGLAIHATDLVHGFLNRTHIFL